MKLIKNTPLDKLVKLLLNLILKPNKKKLTNKDNINKFIAGCLKDLTLNLINKLHHHTSLLQKYEKQITILKNLFEVLERDSDNQVFEEGLLNNFFQKNVSISDFYYNISVYKDLEDDKQLERIKEDSKKQFDLRNIIKDNNIGIINSPLFSIDTINKLMKFEEGNLNDFFDEIIRLQSNTFNKKLDLKILDVLLSHTSLENKLENIPLRRVQSYIL